MLKANKFVIGLTGGIGSGKTTVSDIFSELDIDIIDADIVARQAVAPKSLALESIKARYGGDIIDHQGQLARSKLRSIIFSDKNEKRWLDSLLHPIIREKMLNELNNSSSPYCILVAPLLIENNLQPLVQRILVVDSDNDKQIQRTCQRDDSNEREVKRIIASQVDRETRLSYADDIIDNNNASFSDLKQQVINLHNTYLELTAKPNYT